MAVSVSGSLQESFFLSGASDISFSSVLPGLKFLS